MELCRSFRFSKYIVFYLVIAKHVSRYSPIKQAGWVLPIHFTLLNANVRWLNVHLKRGKTGLQQSTIVSIAYTYHLGLDERVVIL